MFSFKSLRCFLLTSALIAGLQPAFACEQMDTPKNQIGNLPAALKAVVPSTLGVEKFSQTTPANGKQFAAAILTPKKWFVPCGMDHLADNDPTERLLVVWQASDSKWEQIGRNSQIIYSIDTAGETAFQLAWQQGQLRVRQEMQANSVQTADQFTLIPDVASKRLQVAAWTSTSLDDPACCGNGDEAMFNQLDKAKAKYGADKVCERDGYAGTIDYTSGKLLINRCEYAKPKRSLSKQVASQKIDLNQFKPGEFDQQHGIPK